MQGLCFVSRVQQLILHVVGLTDDVAVQLTEAIPQGQVFRVDHICQGLAQLTPGRTDLVHHLCTVYFSPSQSSSPEPRRAQHATRAATVSSCGTSYVMLWYQKKPREERSGS